MLLLCRDAANMLFPAVCFFLRCGTGLDAAITAVIADARGVIFDDRGVVGVMDDRFVHVIHGGVVEKVAVVPAAAIVSSPAVAVSIVDAAVEANVLSPIT